MKSETTASTQMPQPAIAMPVWPVGTNTEPSPRARAARSSSSATVIFPIAQSEPTVSTIRAGTRRFSPVGTFRPSGGRRRSRSSTPWRRGELGELRVVGDELVQAVLDVEAARDAAPRGARATWAGSGRRRWRRRRPPSSARSGVRSVDRADDRDAVLHLAGPGRVEERDDRRQAVVDDPARRLAVVRVAGEVLGQDEVALLGESTPRPAACSTSPAPGRSAARRQPNPSRRPRRRYPSSRVASTSAARTRQVPSGRRFDSTQVECVGGARVVEADRALQRGQADERVVVPVGRIGELEEDRVRRLAGPLREDEAVTEQELGAACCGLGRHRRRRGPGSAPTSR